MHIAAEFCPAVLQETSKNLSEDSSPWGCGRLSPVTSPSNPMGDEVPAPGPPGVEAAAGADSSGTCVHLPFATVQLFQALSPGGTRQASPVTELGRCMASEAAQAPLAAPGHEPGNRAATQYRAVANHGAAKPDCLFGMLTSCVTMTYVTSLCPGLSTAKGGESNSAIPHRGIKIH